MLAQIGYNASHTANARTCKFHCYGRIYYTVSHLFKE